MKITISRSQWQEMGKKAGWIKKASDVSQHPSHFSSQMKLFAEKLQSAVDFHKNNNQSESEQLDGFASWYSGFIMDVNNGMLSAKNGEVNSVNSIIPKLEQCEKQLKSISDNLKLTPEDFSRKWGNFSQFMIFVENRVPELMELSMLTKGV